MNGAFTKTAELKAILKRDGVIHVKTYAQDCDGVEGYSNRSFESIDDYNEGLESWIDGCEGKATWEVVSKENLYDDDECGRFGHGWDIN